MSVNKAAVNLHLTITDTIVTVPTSWINTSRNTVELNGGDVSQNLTASSTPNVTSSALGEKALVAGAVTLDLTALTGPEGSTVSFDTLKPRAILFENPSGNTNSITIAKGAVNGYTGLGAAFNLTLKPGRTALVYLGSDGDTVSATVKTLDLTGTGTQALRYKMIAGT